MKWYEQDSGKLQMITNEHRGRVSDFLYMQNYHKLFLSCANDGVIVVWGCGGNILEKIKVSTAASS